MNVFLRCKKEDITRGKNFITSISKVNSSKLIQKLLDYIHDICPIRTKVYIFGKTKKRKTRKKYILILTHCLCGWGCHAAITVIFNLWSMYKFGARCFHSSDCILMWLTATPEHHVNLQTSAQRKKRKMIKNYFH